MTRLNHSDLVELILTAVDKILHMEKGQVLEAEGVRLHPSEIHLLLFLHGRPDVNLTEIADRFGVTKGAVSQVLSRLERKGVLNKSRKPQNPKELSLSFTELGGKVLVRALELKGAAERRFDAHLSAMTEADREAVRRFFQRVTRGIDPVG